MGSLNKSNQISLTIQRNCAIYQSIPEIHNNKTYFGQYLKTSRSKRAKNWNASYPNFAIFELHGKLHRPEFLTSPGIRMSGSPGLFE